MATKHIAILTHGYAVGGGVPAVTRWLHKELLETRAYKIDLIDLATSRKDENSRRLTGPSTWYRSSLRSRSAEGYYSFGANAVELEFMRYRPRRELTEFMSRYDLLQVVAGSPAWGAVARQSRVPLVIQTATTARWERQHSLPFTYHPAQLWRKAMTTGTTAAEGLALRRANAVMVENKLMMRHVETLGQSQVYLAPPGVDTTVFSPSSEGHRDGGHILSVCRLGDPRKGLDRLVESYKLLVARNSYAPRLILAGRGNLPKSITEQIKNSGLDSRVDVVSDVSLVDLISLYRKASVFVQTSHEEGLGISVLEAMACGLPVVATATAGSSEIVVHGKTGWLVQQDEPDLTRIIADHLEFFKGSQATSFGVAARVRCVTHFSAAATIQKFTDVYSNILESSNKF